MQGGETSLCLSALLCAKPRKGQRGTQGCAAFLPAALVMERSTLAFLCPTAAPYLDTAGPIGCYSSARSWGLAHSSDAAATQHPLHLPLLCNTCPELSISEAAASHPTAASARILPGVHPPHRCQRAACPHFELFLSQLPPVLQAGNGTVLSPAPIAPWILLEGEGISVSCSGCRQPQITWRGSRRGSVRGSVPSLWVWQHRSEVP